MASKHEAFEPSPDILAIAGKLRSERHTFALATVIETQGSASAQAGAKALFDAEGAVIAGWVGGGCAEATVAHAALECLSSGETQIIDLDLNDEVLGTGMPCGGSMRVYVEPFPPKPVLWILGHGRVAECLCTIGAMIGLEPVIHDPLATRARFPAAARVISDDDGYQAVTPARDDFVVVATQHKGDHQSLRALLSRDGGYIALIASHKRTKLVLDYLRDGGFKQTAIDRIRSPAGLDLGARTPEEIALSVLSEIVLTRRRGSNFAIHAVASAADARPEHDASGSRDDQEIAGRAGSVAGGRSRSRFATAS